MFGKQCFCEISQAHSLGLEGFRMKCVLGAGLMVIKNVLLYLIQSNSGCLPNSAGQASLSAFLCMHKMYL